MMKVFRHTLVSEGTTDANLIPILDWSLKQVGGVALSQGTRAEFWRLQEKPKNLAERLAKAVELSPCDVLFVHRDADREPPDERVAEMRDAFATLRQQGIQLPAVAVVPVRMMEAWLCFDEQAIRKAAGHPNGTASLGLPTLKRVESRPDPKSDLRRALQAASEHTGRKLKKFNTEAAFWRIVDYIQDFSPLRELAAFRTFEKSIADLREAGWKAGFYS